MLGCGQTRHAGGARPAACLFGVANKHWGSNCRTTRVCRLPAGSKGEGTAARASSVGIHGIQRYGERLAMHPTDCYDLASAKGATGCLDVIRPILIPLIEDWSVVVEKLAWRKEPATRWRLADIDQVSARPPVHTVAESYRQDASQGSPCCSTY